MALEWLRVGRGEISIGKRKRGLKSAMGMTWKGDFQIGGAKRSSGVIGRLWVEGEQVKR